QRYGEGEDFFPPVLASRGRTLHLHRPSAARRVERGGAVGVQFPDPPVSGLLSFRAYAVSDGTGEITVVTDRGVPKKGGKVHRRRPPGLRSRRQEPGLKESPR